LHTAGLAEAVALAEALDLLPPELIYYGVQPAKVGWTVGLSREVQSAVTAVSESILLELSVGDMYTGVEYTGNQPSSDPLGQSN